MSIYVGGPTTDYSAMKGPCSTGYHIPTSTERTAVKTAYTALGASWSNVLSYLKIPLAGGRYASSAQAFNQGSSGNYWVSDYSGTGYANMMSLMNSNMNIATQATCYGQSIRPFKDKAVTPDSSWTTIYQGSGSAGIFWSSSLGLISISSDGTTRITIADKNLGATTVYSGSGTLSQNNCGYYYQRGNNYGFAWTGSITTSTTRVNASTYGPSNYYSSSTFIYGGSSPYSWDSSYNANLRGGTTGVVQSTGEIKNIYVGTTPVKEVYVGTTKVRPAGGGSYTPTANTIAYYPLTDDFNDHKTSGTLYNLTSNSVQLTTLSGVKCANLNSSYCSANFVITTLPYTLSFYYKLKYTSGNGTGLMFRENSSWGGSGFLIRNGNVHVRYGNPTNTYDNVSYTMNTNRNQITITMASNGAKIYINGSLFSTPRSSLSAPSANGSPFYIGHDNGDTTYGNAYVGSVIVENKARSATEVSDYYNLTKGNYGL